jgi:hypothetical protein
MVVTQRYPSLSQKPTIKSDFEKLVFASTTAAEATSILSYRVSVEAVTKYVDVFNTSFFTSWNLAFPQFPQPDQQPAKVGNNFEMDCCLMPNETSTLFSIFQDVFERDPRNVVCINQAHFRLEDFSIDNGECIHFEITADKNLLAKKIFQLERAMQLWDVCIPGCPRPKAAGVIVTGSLEDFESVLSRINCSIWGPGPTPMVFSVPVFVIFSPFRNIYSNLSQINGQLSVLGTKIAHVGATMLTISDLATVATTGDLATMATKSELNERFNDLDKKLDKILSHRFLCLCALQ